jgi:cytochrome c biogenesis protein CcmG/thiol:disulfide interchange protein DsbE
LRDLESVVKRLIFLLPLLIFAILAGYFLWGLDPQRDPNAIPIQMVDKAVPDFDLAPVEGLATPGLSRNDLADEAKRRTPVRLVNVFASWCVPCRAEHPILSRLAEREDVTVYGINYKDQPADAVAWLENLGNPYAAVGSDPKGTGAIAWGIRGVPETFIVGPEGRIRHHHVGPIHATELEEIILPMIEELSR